MLKCIQVNTIQIANISNLNWKKDLSTNYSLNCEVNELSDVTIYNVITLNENGKNDYLVIKNIEFFPQNNMSIFNRDGTLLSSIDKYGEQNRFFRGITKSNKELNLQELIDSSSYPYGKTDNRNLKPSPVSAHKLLPDECMKNLKSSWIIFSASAESPSFTIFVIFSIIDILYSFNYSPHIPLNS